MATQSTNFSATGLPASGSFIKSADVNTTLQALINDYNLQIGPNKIAPNAVFSANIANEAWTAWTPSYGASSPMTFTGVTTNIANYIQYGKIIIYRIDAQGTTGGSAGSYLTFTPPQTLKDSLASMGSGLIIDDGGNSRAAFTFGVSSTVIGVQRYDAANLAIRANESFRLFGIMEAL